MYEQFANNNHAAAIQHLFWSYQHSNSPEKSMFQYSVSKLLPRKHFKVCGRLLVHSGHQAKVKYASKKCIKFTKTSDWHKIQRVSGSLISGDFHECLAHCWCCWGLTENLFIQFMEPAFDASLNLKCWQIILPPKKEKQGDPLVPLQVMLFSLEQL